MFIPLRFIGLLALVFALKAPLTFAEGGSERERRNQDGPTVGEQRIVGVARARIADGGISLDVVDDGHLTHFWLENVEENKVCSRPDMPYPYKCAFRGLGEIVQGRTVVCTTKGVQHRWPDGFLARCSVDGLDIGEEMVRKGYAHSVGTGWPMMAGGSGVARELGILGAVIAVSIGLALLKPVRRWATRD